LLHRIKDEKRKSGKARFSVFAMRNQNNNVTVTRAEAILRLTAFGTSFEKEADGKRKPSLERGWRGKNCRDG